MAAEETKLGFDVSQALTALETLNDKFTSTFSSMATTMTAWNGQATSTVSALGAMAANAKAAASAFRELASAQQRAGAAAKPSVVTGGGGINLGQPRATPTGYDTIGGAGKSAVVTAGQIDKVTVATDGATRATKGLAVSWNTIGRVVMTQAIVRAMSAVRDALSEAVTSSLQFQKNIAEIRTVAPQLGGSFESLANEAANFSRNFNVPLPQVTEGLYQTISDQFTSMSDRSNIMSAAMKLSKTAVMDFGDAVTLITGTLNAYGQSSGEAENVAAKFFKTIELGHIRGKELAAVMGSIEPIAAELNIPLQDLNAAMVSMTIGGLGYARAATALRGTLTALLKPSEDLKKIMRDMGFGSPEQLIAAKGYQGALEAIAAATGDMSSETAKSFRNVRGLVGELRLTGEGAVKVAEAMKAMETFDPTAFNKIFEQFKTTDAEKLTKEFNSLKVTLTQDFGSAIVGTLNTLMQMVGGAGQLSSVIMGLATAFGVAAVALTALIVKQVMFNAAVMANPVGLVISAAAIAFTVLAGSAMYSYQAQTNAARESVAAQQKASQDIISAKAEERRKLTEESNKALDEQTKAWAEGSAKMMRAYFRTLDAAKIANDEVVASAKSSMATLIADQEARVVALKNDALKFIKEVQTAQKNQKDAAALYADTVFAHQNRQYSKEEQIQNLLRRGRILAIQGAKEMASAKSPEDLEAARAKWERGSGFVQQGVSGADSLNNLQLVEDAQRAELSVIKQKESAERSVGVQQKKNADAMSTRARGEQENLNKMKAAMGFITKDMDAFTAKGPKSEAQRKAATDRIEQNFKAFKFFAAKGKDAGTIDQFLGLDKMEQVLKQKMESSTAKVDIAGLTIDAKKLADFNRLITDGIGPITVPVKIMRERFPEETQGKNASEVMDMANQFHGSTVPTQIKDSRAVSDAIAVNIASYDRGLKDAMDNWAAATQERAKADAAANAVVYTPHGSAVPSRREKHVQTTMDIVAQAFDEQVQKITSPAFEVSPTDFVDTQRAYLRYIEVLKPGVAEKGAVDALWSNVQQILSAKEQLAKQKGGQKYQSDNLEKNKATMDLLDKAVPTDKVKTLNEGLDKSKGAASATKDSLSSTSQLNMAGLTAQLNAAADAMIRLAQASMSVPNMSATMTAASGGLAYLAGGGQPQGTDTIPAMLSAGERVINTSASRKFASQLIAMNAGVKPVFRNEGGSVTNVGDISVTVNGGASGRQTGRDIATQIKRELRRGTSSL